MYLAAMPDRLSGSPTDVGGVALHDVLSALLSTIRLSGSLQFCFMPTGHWQTDATPSMARMSGRGSGTMPFHILVEGTCWIKVDDIEATLAAGDVVMFPFGTGHQLGVGSEGKLITPTRDLPPKPWREIPVLQYGDEEHAVHLLCGYLQCEAVGFAPFGQALPKMIHVKTQSDGDVGWLAATVQQMVAEIERPRAGGVSMLPRLTEIIFIEILRHQIMSSTPQSVGWLAALADPSLSRCLSLIHDAPMREWSLEALAGASGMSRSALADRFQAMLGTSPIRYVRDWRLYLASVALATTGQSISAIAFEAGYESEAAFNRAFARSFGSPPAAWRAAMSP